MTRLNVVGTSDWRSYALFHAGVRCEQNGDVVSAEALYAAALKQDERNRAARVNFAGILLQKGESDRAIEQLRDAKNEAENADGLSDPVYYAAVLRLSTALFNQQRYKEANEEVATIIRRIYDQLTDMDQIPGLSERANRIIDWLGDLPLLSMVAKGLEALLRRRAASRHAATKNEALQNYLLAVLPAMKCMHVGTRIAVGERDAIAEAARLDSTRPAAMYQYNLACTLSIAAEHTKKKAEENSLVEKALAQMSFSLELQPRNPEVVLSDPSFGYIAHRYPDRLKKILISHPPPGAAIPVVSASQAEAAGH